MCIIGCPRICSAVGICARRRAVVFLEYSLSEIYVTFLWTWRKLSFPTRYRTRAYGITYVTCPRRPSYVGRSWDAGRLGEVRADFFVRKKCQVTNNTTRCSRLGKCTLDVDVFITVVTLTCTGFGLYHTWIEDRMIQLQIIRRLPPHSKALHC